MKLTKYFIRKKVQHLAPDANVRPHEFCTLNEANHILVLFHAADRELVEPCLEKLRRQKKQVHACVYVAEDTTPEMNASYFLVHVKNDLDAWYSPKESTVQNCNALKADILIDLTSPKCYSMQYLLLQHPCRFKVGIKHDVADLYDLAISVTERDNIKQLFEHILFYLQSIRSK